MSEFEDEEEIISVDDIVQTIDDTEMSAIIDEVALANAVVVYRINPPDNLTEFEADIWNRIMHSVVPGWIAAKDIEQLVGYCRCVSSIEFYNQQMKDIIGMSGYDPTDKAFYQSYAKWAELSAKSEGLLLSYARALRLTNSAFRSDEKKVTNIRDSKELWEDDE